ncbi:MAG: universal stress protein [Acidobacteria bacterium]|nr:universal stress protein [Acidobacteriota bacterium]
MKILLSIDDSKFSEAATRMLVEQNQPRQTTVRVLHVVEPLEIPFYPELTDPYPASLDDIRKKRKKAGQELVARAVEKVRKSGFQVDGVVRGGHVRTTVVDVAAKWHADLIVVGSHGRKGLTRVLLGSVSDYVARHAWCSVEIVRRQR